MRRWANTNTTWCANVKILNLQMNDMECKKSQLIWTLKKKEKKYGLKFIHRHTQMQCFLSLKCKL